MADSVELPVHGSSDSLDSFKFNLAVPGCHEEAPELFGTEIVPQLTVHHLHAAHSEK